MKIAPTRVRGQVRLILQGAAAEALATNIAEGQDLMGELEEIIAITLGDLQLAGRVEGFMQTGSEVTLTLSVFPPWEET